MATAWFKDAKSASKGVYMEKKVWDTLLGDNFRNIEMTLGNCEHSDQMLSRIRYSFQMGFNERFKVFLQELDLAIGDAEKKALKARNRMTHASSGNSQKEVEEMLYHTQAYRTLFHRVFLRLLDYGGEYVDYSALGFPQNPIGEPAKGRP